MWRFVLSDSVDTEVLGDWLLWALTTLGQGQTTRVEQDFTNWHLTAYRVGDILRIDMKPESTYTIETASTTDTPVYIYTGKTTEGQLPFESVGG